MKVLVVGDFTSQPCGIRNFADQTVTALARHPGLEVTPWDGYYPEIYRRREAGEPAYLPADAETYDVIHVNWHPIAFNTYGPDHFPCPRARAYPDPPGRLPKVVKGPILSVYLHDIPPWSGCPFHERADVCFTSEPSPGCVVLPYPVADWVELPPCDPTVFSVGCSTLRGDGVAEVEAICAARGWPFRVPDRTAGWRAFEEEVQRIARNTVNVLWYHEGRGKSGGLSQTIAARRPVIISESPMFDHFAEYYWELYRGANLEKLLQFAYTDWVGQDMMRPISSAEGRSWSKATAQMVAAWEAARQ